MKIKYLIICILLIIINCKNNIQGQSYNEIYRNIVKAYIEYNNSDKELDRKNNILLIGASTSENDQNSYWLDIWFVNPKLLFNFKYTNVYEIEGYKLIIDESLDKSNKLKNIFNTIKYENLNLATKAIDYSVKNWHIVFNSKNEVIRILPQQESKKIMNLLLTKGIRFSQDYED